MTNSGTEQREVSNHLAKISQSGSVGSVQYSVSSIQCSVFSRQWQYSVSSAVGSNDFELVSWWVGELVRSEKVENRIKKIELY